VTNGTKGGDESLTVVVGAEVVEALAAAAVA
jgi:hypothetical protein